MPARKTAQRIGTGASITLAAYFIATTSAMAACGTYAAPYCHSQPVKAPITAPILPPVGTVLHQPSVVYTPAPTPGLTYAASNVRLAGPPIQSRDIHRGVTYIEPAPVVRAQYIRHISAPQPAPVHPKPITRTVTQAQTHTSAMTHMQTVKMPAPQIIRQPLAIPKARVLPAPAITLCYAGRAQRYDRWGRAIGSSCYR